MPRILVIDDDADMRSVLEQSLQAAGYEVDLAETGLEGMAHFHSKPVDVVVTDLIMSQQEGLETIIKFRNEFPGIPIIAISGNTAAKPLLTIARRLGAAAILQKPFPPDHLISEVQRALRSRARSR